MNLSNWRKAAALVTQHKQEAAVAETDQLSSVPLSQVVIDDSGLPVVHYGTHVPVAASTPTGRDKMKHDRNFLAFMEKCIGNNLTLNANKIQFK